MRVTVGAKIFAGFLAVLLSFAGVSAYALYRLGQIRESFHLVSGGYLKLALLVTEVERLQHHLTSQVATAETAGRAATNRLERESVLVRKLRQDRATKAAEVAREAGLTDFAHTSEELSSHFHDMDALYAEGAWDRVARRESKLGHDATDLKNDVSKRVLRLALDLEEEESRQVWWQLGLAVLALLIGAIVTFGAHATLRPLVTLTARVRRIARGDEPLGDPFTVKAHDEIGDLAQAWNQMAGALRQREEQLVRSERLAAVGRMAAHITHEVRNPLSSIALNAELLEDELGESVEGGRLLRAIGSEVDRLTAITEEYLRFARLPRPKLEREDLAALAERTLDFMKGEVAAAGVHLALDLETAPVLVDENQIRQALLNLVRNALEATPPGGRLLIKTGPGPASDGTARTGLEVRVIDSGAGISDEVAHKIFDPFFTTKDRGTGLGLALTQQIVLDHGGNIRCERVPSGGTAFIVWLPDTETLAETTTPGRTQNSSDADRLLPHPSLTTDG